VNPTGDGPAVLNHTWFLDVPKVTLDPSVSELARIKLRLAGPLSIQADGVDGATRQVRLSLTVGALLEGTIEQVPQPEPETQLGAAFAPDPSFDLRVSFTPVTVVDSKLRVVDGSALPDEWIDLFESPFFRLGLGMELADTLADIQSALPGRVAPILDTLRIGNGSTATVTGIVGDKFATFGIDVSNALFGIATSGDPAAVGNFLGGADLALVVDEAVRPLLDHAARTEINNRQSSADVTSLTLAFGNGHFDVSGHAEADVGSADFSFQLTPVLGKAEQVEWYDDEYGGQYPEVISPATDEIWLDLSNLEVDEDLAWWAILVLASGAVFLSAVGPAGPAALGQFVNAMLLAAQVQTVKTVEGTNTQLARRWEGTLPDTEAPNIQFKIESLEVFDDRVETRLSITPQWPTEETITGPAVGIYDIFNWQKFTLSPPFRNYDLADPELRVRWQLRRSDTNEVLKQVDHAPGADTTFSHRFSTHFSPYGVGHTGLSEFTLSARVYRSGGGPSFDYLNTTRTISISDRLDRSHPYVHWHHHIPTPEVVDGKQIGWRQNSRQSVIHRTDVPARCKFVASFSAEVEQPDYLEALPFPLDELAANRDDVCDYCFYGGPTKTTAKIGGKKIQPAPGG
jgi:hypothetical protein